MEILVAIICAAEGTIMEILDNWRVGQNALIHANRSPGIIRSLCLALRSGAFGARQGGAYRSCAEVLRLGTCEAALDPGGYRNPSRAAWQGRAGGCGRGRPSSSSSAAVLGPLGRRFNLLPDRTR